MKTYTDLHFALLKNFLHRSYKLLRLEKSNFYIFFIAFALGTTGNIITFYIAFNGTGSLLGWNIYSALALLATYRLCRGIFGTFIGENLNNMFQTIRSGELDMHLIKPASAWFLLSFAKIDLSRSVDLVTALLLLFFTLFYLPWTWFSLLLYFIMCVISLILVTCTYVLASFTAFFNLKNSTLDFIEKLMRACTRYPLRFANGAVQFIFTWLIPFMFITTIPVEMLENRGFMVTTLMSGIVLSVFYIWLTRWCWQKCLLRYSSASS